MYDERDVTPKKLLVVKTKFVNIDSYSFKVLISNCMKQWNEYKVKEVQKNRKEEKTLW
jgi:hypothetical protein